MNIRDANGHYERHTTTLSTVLRQSAFAGIAISWTFRSTLGGRGYVEGALAWAAGLYVLGLLVDVTQYALQSARWQLFIKAKTEELHTKHGEDLQAKIDEQFSIPLEVNKAGRWAFWTKFVLFVFGHLVLLGRLIGLAA